MSTERLADVAFPARDQSLARAIAGISEPDAGRAADNLITNEDSFARVAADLRRLAPAGGVYLGVGPDQNLSYIAQCRPRLAFVLDFRRRNALVHLAHKALFAASPDRAGYLARLLARTPRALPADPSAAELVAAFEGVTLDRPALEASIAASASILGALGVLADPEFAEVATIRAKLAGPGLSARFLALPIYPTLARLIQARDRGGMPGHFLADEGWYRTVRQAHLGDRIIPLTGDFAGPFAMPRLAEWLRGRGLRVSVLYVSDVEFFLLRAGRFAAFAANLARLPWAEGAVLIRASTREIEHPERHPGDSSTTILRPVAPFLDAAHLGRVEGAEDLFR